MPLPMVACFHGTLANRRTRLLLLVTIDICQIFQSGFRKLCRLHVEVLGEGVDFFERG